MDYICVTEWIIHMFGEKKIIPCFAHTVNLAIDNPLTKTAETASQIIGKVRSK